MIKAATPGCGKSYICEKLPSLGYTPLFICPTNKLVLKYEEAGIDAVTIHKFFNIQIEGIADKKIAKFDRTPFDSFVFDEV